MIQNNEIEFYKKVINELDIVFDVGCRNDEIFTDLNPNIETHLFDVERYKKKYVGKFNQVAVSNKAATYKFYLEYSSLIKRTELNKQKKFRHFKHNYIEVEAITLDEYCKANNIDKIDFLKIDVEGFDYEVLLGAKNILKTVTYIQFEDWFDKTKKILKLLENDYNFIKLNGKPTNYIAVRK